MPESRTPIVVFRTLPDERNSNPAIESHFSRALARVAVGRRVVRCSSALAVDTIQAVRPGLVVGIGSLVPDDVSYAAIFRACRRAGAPLVYWQLDDPYEFDFGWKLEGACDWVFTTDRASIDYYAIGGVSHLPLAADADSHFRPLVPLRARPVDIFFCGVAYANRQRIVNALRGTLAGCTTRITGSGWDTRLPFCANRRLDADQIIEGYATAKLVLGIGRQFDIANRRFEIVPSTPGPRIFEAAAAGCVQAVYLESMELFDHFERGSEILHFDGADDFAEIVRRAREEPEALDRVAEAAQRRTRAAHTYDHRCRDMLDRLAREGVFDESVPG